MPKQAQGPLLPIFAADAAEEPLFRQIYRRLRDAVLSGALLPGARLPSSRSLARELGVSRNTVVTALDELVAEGYLEPRVGSGTYVAAALPENLLHTPPASAPASSPASLPAGPPPTPARPRSWEPDPILPFRAGVPALDRFPLAVWRRLQARRWRSLGSAELHYGSPAGWKPLREAVAGYLRTARGVRCDAEQVMIVSSCQAAIDLAARLLLQPGERAWVEEPGYLGAVEALRSRGAVPVPVPVDAEGLDVAAGRALAPDARLAYVTPSCQYPLGVTLGLRRRLELLAWAAEAGAWILEDDYDSEYRYAGRPLAALQGLDRPGAERVIYLGTFSKVMFPALRIAYAVLPHQLAEPFARLRRYVDDHTSLPAQMVLHDFIAEGYFSAHVRRTRLCYAERQEALLHSVSRHLGGLVEADPAPAGMQVVARLAPGLGIGDSAVAEAARRAGVMLLALSDCHAGPPLHRGLLLGYSGFPPEALDRAARRLADVIGKTAPRWTPA
ncbi:PLP-dependent aminotransferase family protein [Arenibaculum sp.]|jgi:GntR family transcriptional regulator/MocR family aminotransferase|uniref:MocR-like pyridoxine biosynthesis transcription factor PdxR n=1 Tax=Arenibaculum sp. TaxID=2865862 RepID=UPI002E15D61C|nr:PLP-dependent aminotransferase family protein [Arenibaculum sp.]